MAKIYDRYSYRARPAAFVIRHGGDDMTIRRVALLRCWDLGERFDYAFDPSLGAGLMRVETPTGEVLGEQAATMRILRSTPGLWWLLPFAWIAPVGRFGRRIIGLPTLAVR